MSSTKDLYNPNACNEHQDQPYGQRGCMNCADNPTPSTKDPRHGANRAYVTMPKSIADYYTTPPTTDSSGLDEVLNDIDFKLKPVVIGGSKFADEIVITGKRKAKQAILTHIDTVCREARGCADCKKPRCENCERLWQS